MQVSSAAVRPLTPGSRYGRAWDLRLRSVPVRRAARALGVWPGQTVLVVTAHPDDETLGLGGAIASLAEEGVRVEVLCATAGEGAYAAAGLPAPGLAELRVRELAGAARALEVARLEQLRLPDGRVAAHEQALAVMISRHLAGREDIGHVAALWERDPHPDHAAVGRAAATAARHRGVPVSGFPVWAFHWSDPEAVLPAGSPACVVEVGPYAAARRRRALRCHTSQTSPPAEGLGPVVPADVAAWSTEILVPM